MDGGNGEDQACQWSREPAVDALGGGDHGQHAEGNARRPAVDVANLAGQPAGLSGRGGGGPAPRVGVAPRRAPPRMAGIWRTTISTAIPASTPVITGVERNSAIHPSRKAPTATSAAPTSRAVKAIATP